MARSSKAVANFLLERAWRDGRKLDPMQIQKLVYIAHGRFLAAYEEPLVEESFEAWPYGPVEPEIYHAFKRYGAGTIGALASDGFRTPTLPQTATLEIETLEAVWLRYGRQSGVQLSQMTHVPGSPWEETKTQSSSKGAKIPNERIRAYYQQHSDL